MSFVRLIFAIAIIVVSGTHVSRVPAGSPNVLLVIADDLNCAIGPYGDTVARTPNLDRLAARGMTFDRAYCQQAVCNPSRSSFLTGLRPNVVGVDDLRKYFRDTAPDGNELVTLPQHFKNHGYFCQDIGKIFHNMGETQDRRSWSMDEVLYRGTHADDTVYRNRLRQGAKPKLKAPVTESHRVPDVVYRDGQIANLAASALRDYEFDEQPFFLAVGFWRPHLPFVAPARYWEMYGPESIPMPKPSAKPRGVPQIAMHGSREVFGYGEKRENHKFSPSEIRHLRHGYYASISFLDAQLGEIIDALDASPHAHNTIVVFTSDHGFHIGEHALWGKTSNFELDARVPLIISAPEYSDTAGSHTDALCELLDLYPTLADLAGNASSLSPTLGGTSLVPVLKDPENHVKEVALTQHQQPFYGSRENWKAWGYSMRTDRWRLTHWRDIKEGHTIAVELYDHQSDPLETQNVAADPTNGELLDQLTSRLEREFELTTVQTK